MRIEGKEFKGRARYVPDRPGGRPCWGPRLRCAGLLGCSRRSSGSSWKECRWMGSTRCRTNWCSCTPHSNAAGVERQSDLPSETVLGFKNQAKKSFQATPIKQQYPRFLKGGKVQSHKSQKGLSFLSVGCISQSWVQSISKW